MEQEGRARLGQAFAVTQAFQGEQRSVLSFIIIIGLGGSSISEELIVATGVDVDANADVVVVAVAEEEEGIVGDVIFSQPLKF